MRIKLFVVFVLLLLSTISALGALGAPDTPINDYVNSLDKTINRSERVEGWTCYNYSVDFAKNNPDFEVVTVSRSPEFKGISHMTNYQFYDNETMIVYDGLLDKLYFVYDLQWDVEDYNYYYFWVNETPTRECVDMVDNRNVVL